MVRGAVSAECVVAQPTPKVAIVVQTIDVSAVRFMGEG